MGDYNYFEYDKGGPTAPMMMNWDLRVMDTMGTTAATLEVNGQMTMEKLFCGVLGGPEMIAVVLEQREGGDWNLKPGDTLFMLNRQGKNLRTTWEKMEPQLTGDLPKTCTCFRKI